MNTDTSTCQSCGMTIESGPYCQYCLDEKGNLQSFEERLTRLVQFMHQRDPAISGDQARSNALEYMRSMPAWRNNPEVVASEQPGGKRATDARD